MAFYTRNDQRARFLEFRKMDQVGGLPLLSDQVESRDLEPGRFKGYRRMHERYNTLRPMTYFGYNLWGGGTTAAHSAQILTANHIEVVWSFSFGLFDL